MSDNAHRHRPRNGDSGQQERGAPELADAPLLDEVLPWSVPPLRLGREWVLAPDTASLHGRWEVLTGAPDESARAALLRPSRARTLHSAVAPLPGRPAHTGRLAHARGGCPEPVAVSHGPYDQQWLIPDSRLIDAARPELWRVCDAHQTHLIETAYDAGLAGPVAACTVLLPDGHSPAGRPGRIRPFYRRPGGAEPNLAPGLVQLLGARLESAVDAEEVLAWVAAVVCGVSRKRGEARGRARLSPVRVVPFTANRELWRRGVALGRRSLWLHTRGARGAPGAPGTPGVEGAPGPAAPAGATGTGDADISDVPRLPGGRRPYVRAPLPSNPGPEALDYDPDERALHIGEGRIAPVDRSAWEFEVSGAPVLQTWFRRRTEPAEAGTLAAVRPRVWPREWTSQLLELITTLTLLGELRAATGELVRELAEEAAHGTAPNRSELRRAGVLPPPESARRPASVLDPDEEGPEGQLSLL